jgi:hypothetical protein
MDRRAIFGFIDRGGRSSLTCRERTKIESEIFRFFAGREASPRQTARGKLEEIFAKEGTRFCGTKGSVKSEGNILPNLSLYLRLLLREIRNLWVKRGHVALGYYAIFFFQCYRHVNSSYWSNKSDLEDKVHLKRVGVLRT